MNSQIEPMFIKFINDNADRIKGLIAFSKLTESELLQMIQEMKADDAAKFTQP